MKKTLSPGAWKSTPAISRLFALMLASQAGIVDFDLQAQSAWNASTGLWSSDANWLPASIPISSSVTSLNFGGGTGYTTTNDLGTFTLSQLAFTNSAGTIVLDSQPAGNALQFVNSASAMLPMISLEGAGSATVAAPVNWDANAAVLNAGSGTLLFSGAQTYANGTKQTFINSGSGVLTLADGLAYSSAGSNTGVVLQVINHNTAANSFNIGDLGSLNNVTLRVGGAGTVRFAGSAGDLFSGSGNLQVLNGGTFDFNGNAESMGAIFGEGTIRLSGATGVTMSAAGHYLFSGKLTGNGSVNVAATNHTLELSGSASDYTAATSVTAGRLIVSANAPSGSAGALGSTTSEVLVGGTSGNSPAALLIGAADVTIGRNVRLQSGSTGTVTLGALNSSGVSTFSGNITLGTNSAAAKGLTIFSTPGGTMALDGNLLRATAATGTTDTLTLNGGGKVILRGSNSFTGSTTINGGTLQLDHSANNDAKISGSGLMLQGGSLSISGNMVAPTNVTVSELVLGTSISSSGGGQIIVTSGMDQNATLTLNAITRHSGATMDFSTVNSGSGLASIMTTTPNTSAGILGAYASANLNGWAANDGTGSITPLPAGSYGTAFVPSAHTSLSANVTLASGGASTHTLRFTSAMALSFNATTQGTLTLESGGMLVVPGTGNVTIGATTRRGALSTPDELIVHQNSTNGTLTIHSPISALGLTKAGPGTLVLTGTSTYTGNTLINGGTLSITASANLGAATADVVINGGILALPSGTAGTLNAANRVITIGPAGGTLHFTANQSFEGTGLAGTGNLTLTGPGALIFGSTASAYNGHIFISNGQIRMNSPQLNNVASITVASGATYNMDDDATDTFSLSAAGRLVLNGNGLGGNGALRLTDQTPTIPRNNPVTLFNRDVLLQTDSRIQVDNGSAGGNASRLTLSGNVTGDGGITKTGNGLLILTARDNDYRGATQVQAGTLALNLGNDRLPTATTVTLGSGALSGTLQLNGYSQSIAGLETSGTGTANAVIGGSGTTNSLLTLNQVSGTRTYQGRLGGSGLLDNHANNNLGFEKTGSGSLTLGDANTYSGGTTVAAGTLVLGHSKALGGGGAALSSGTGGTLVSTGATLDLNGQSTIHEIITLNGTGLAGAGALVNNGSNHAVLGDGIASLTVSSFNSNGWSAGATITLDAPANGIAATATAMLGLTSDSYTLTSGGSGYGLVPTISISGGMGASAYALVGVTNASFTVPAAVPGTTTSYSVAPSVTLPNGATGEAVLDANGYVIAINVLSPGSNFITTPTAAFSGGIASFAGTNPTATGNNNNYTITGITLVNAGTGFTTPPTFTITGGTGSGAAVTGNDGAFALNGFVMTDHGSGYGNTPVVNVTGGSATVTANVAGITLASDSSIGGSGDLTIHSIISGPHSLRKVGAGTTVLAAGNTYSGTTLVSEGNLQVGLSNIGTTGLGNVTLNGSSAVLSGSGNIMAPITNIILGTLKPGDQGGAAIGGLGSQSMMFAPTSLATVAELQLSGSAGNSDLAFDTLHIAGDLSLNGFSRIQVDGTGYTPTAGDSFVLIDWSGLLDAGAFSPGSNLRTGADADLNEGLLDLPDIGGFGFWDVAFGSGLLRLTVVVPEPGRAMLLMLGFMPLLMRRRR